MTLTLHQLYEICAQEVHALVGALLFYLLSAYFPRDLEAVGIAYGGLAVVEALKEFYWDVRNEPGETYASGAVDFSFYYVGALAAFFALVLTHKPL